MNLSGFCGAVPAEGRSTEPVVIIGVATMKMTSRTSMTSMYGTTLISFFRRRWRMALSHLALDDVGELFHERLVAGGQTVAVVREAVVGKHGGDRREQANGGGDQRFGDARGDGSQGCLADVGEAAEGVHDAPDGAEQADIRGNRADRGEEGEVGFEGIHLALVGGAHGAAGAVDDVLWVEVFLTTQLGEFAEAGFEDALHGTGMVTIVDRAVVQVVQVATRPEVTLEGFGLRPRLLDGEQLHKDVVPRHQRDAGEQGHDDLDDRAGLQDEVEDGEILGNVHLSASSLEYRKSGMGAGFIVAMSTQAISTAPVTSSSSPRRTCWRKTTRTRVSFSTSRPTVSWSSRWAGRRYSQLALRATKPMPASSASWRWSWPATRIHSVRQR